MHGGTCVYRHPTGKRSHSVGEQRGVRCEKLDLVDVGSKSVGSNLSEHRRVTLSLGRCSGKHANLAGREHADSRSLMRAKTRSLNHVGYADSQITPFLACLLLAILECRVVG